MVYLLHTKSYSDMPVFHMLITFIQRLTSPLCWETAGKKIKWTLLMLFVVVIVGYVWFSNFLFRCIFLLFAELAICSSMINIGSSPGHIYSQHTNTQTRNQLAIPTKKGQKAVEGIGSITTNNNNSGGGGNSSRPSSWKQNKNTVQATWLEAKYGRLHTREKHKHQPTDNNENEKKNRRILSG